MEDDVLSTPRHFDLCVIGSGSGNTIVDERFAQMSVALVDKGIGEKEAFGGTCLNAGCIPTKMFVAAADCAISPSKARRLGVELGEARVDFPSIGSRIFGRIDPIAESGLAWRESSPHVTVYRDAARFINEHTLRVGADVITAERFVLAAGSRPVFPEVDGLDDPYLAPMIHTSETIMRIPSLPRRLIIVGGGVEMAEFAHVFSAFGVDVTVINRSDRLLRREDHDVSELFTTSIARRVALKLNQVIRTIEAGPQGGLMLTAYDPHGMQYTYETDAVLFCSGRRSNADTLQVERAGVATDEAGFVVVDEYQRTTASHIWALGDICSASMLKHVANHEARVVQHNLLHPDDLTTSDHRFVPHAIFTSPQIAGVGPTEQELIASGVDYVSVIQPYANVAYGWALEDEEHFVKLLGDPHTGMLLGAHIIGPEASILIQPIIQALHFQVPVTQLARGQYWIHPSLTEVIENAILELGKKIAAAKD